MTNENVNNAKSDDIKAGAKKAIADVENKMAHAKVDAENAKSASPPY
jgi:hypothetical protein